MIRSIRVACRGVAVALLGVIAATVPARAQTPGQTGTVRGQVTEAGSRTPIADAQIVVAGQARIVLTDRDGRYAISEVGPGAVELRIRRIGYAGLDRTVEVPAAGEIVADFALSVEATELAPIVVTATRDARSVTDVPAAVSVADSFALKSSRTAGLHEVLRNTPGVQATSRYGLDDVNLSIRGSGTRTTFGVRGVAVLVDGVPLTEPDGLTRLDLIELGSARQVEVVRGPASAVYGGVASGGAINVITRSGAESQGVTARVQRGSFGFEKYDGSAGTTFAGERGSVYLSGAHTFSRGFRETNSNEMTRFNLRADYRPLPDTRVALEASTSDLDMRIPGALTQDEFERDPFAAAGTNIANRYARRDERYRTGLRLDQRVRAGRTWETTTYAFYSGRTMDHPIFQVLDQNLHRVQLGTRVRVPLDGGDEPRVRATVGADYDNLFGSDDRYVNAGGERGAVVGRSRIELPNLGVYGQVEAEVSARMRLTAGARYDRVRYDILDLRDPANSFEPTFDQLSPKTTLTYRLGGGSSLYGSVARGFEVPTSGEIQYSPDDPSSYNTALKPKTLTNFELGYKTLVGAGLFLDVAVYHAEIDGELIGRSVLLPAQDRSVTVYENAGLSRHNGIEIGWTALLAPALDFVGSYTFSDFKLTEFVSGGEDFSGRRLPGVPQHRLTGELRARPLPNLTGGVAVEWQSKIFVDNANTEQDTKDVRGTPVAFGAVGSYALVHLNAGYRLGDVSVFANLENLFDRQYVGNVTINDGQGRFYSAGAGRYLAVGMSVSALGGGF